MPQDPEQFRDSKKLAINLPFDILTLKHYCNVTNLPELSFRVPFILLVMARHIEILEAILNKNGLDLGYEKGEDPQLPIMEMCDDRG